MPKKQKTPKKFAAADGHESADAPQPIATSEATPPVKTRKKTSKPSARKTAAPRKPKTTKSSERKHGAEPSADQIQLRAYFISEHRQRLGVAGDHHSDWLEARLQLLLEAQRN